MQYNKTAENKFELLSQKNVDTGMGLERTLAALNGLDDNYQTDLFQPIFNKISSLRPPRSKLEELDNLKSQRIIADHLKAAVFIIADGVEPLNVGRGYVLRRLIRRAIRHGKLLGIEKNFLIQLAAVAVEMYEDFYPELVENKNKIFEELEKEENKFRKTLEKGLKEFEKIVRKKEETAKFAIKDRGDLGSKSTDFINLISGNEAFDLYQTYGFPPEMIGEELANYGMGYHKQEFQKEFQKEFEKHKKLSHTASAGQFRGGLAEAGEETAKLHTATHLLLAALREVLPARNTSHSDAGGGSDLSAGEAEIFQKGSNITAERLRFDFNYPQKLTGEQIKKVEDLVNQKIQENIPVEMSEMPKDKALKIAKVSFDPLKYGDTVKVYKIGDFSTEICGGPHAKSTGELGHFKIVKEEASSAGVRRIKAILE